MGKAKKEAKSVDIWKRKKWYSVIAPKVFREAVLGETPALEAEMVNGREVTLSLMSVIGDMKKQNINVTFAVEKVIGEKAFTEIKSYELIPAYIKRMVRRGKDRLDEVYVLHTADKVKVRIKPFAVTNTNTTSSVKRQLRKTLGEELKRRVENLNFSELISMVVMGKLQSELFGIMKKVYPLRNFEIRVLEVVSFADRTEEVKMAPLERKEPPKKTDEDSEEDAEEDSE